MLDSDTLLFGICVVFYIINLGLTIYFAHKREQLYSLLCLGFAILLYLQMMSVPK